MFLYKTIVTLLFICALFSILVINPGCATQGRPGGGPVDKIPPEITLTFPASDSVNVKKLKTIRIHFSESIDESSISNNIFVSPPLKIETEWKSENRLDIHLIDTLKSNQTYVIVLGAKIKDLRNNKMNSSYQLAFSTGAKIDQGSISGKVYGTDQNASLTLFAYGFTSGGMDFNIRPDYVSQTGENGIYRLDYLRNGSYRIFTVNDQNNDLLIDVNRESVGIPFRDVALDSSNAIFSGLNFYLTNIDTVSPKLMYIRPVNSYKINLVFSEKVVLDSLNQIIVKDSVSGVTKDVLATSENIESDNILEVYLHPLDSSRVYILSTINISDFSGNTGRDTSFSFTGRGFEKPDSFRLVEFSPKDSALNIHPASSVFLEFSNPPDRESLRKNIIILNHKMDTLSTSLKFISAFEADLIPESMFSLDEYYSVHLNLTGIKNIWGDSLGDSIMVSSFKISNGSDFGEIAGKVGSENSYKISVSALKLNSKDVYDTWVDADNKYKFNYLPEGLYRISSYSDVDSNAAYSFGHLFPFKYSEPFVVNNDSVKVRKRWETSDVNLTIPKVR